MSVERRSSENDQICFYGMGFGLEPNLFSMYHPNPEMNIGLDCSAKNGCGTHIHSGSSCESTIEQGGHFYDQFKMRVDPWAEVGYYSTNENGSTQFMHCLKTGEKDYQEKVFVIHNNAGARVACGNLLKSERIYDSRRSREMLHELILLCAVSITLFIVLNRFIGRWRSKNVEE